jgi:4-azaleucine resistance transporter AzlC
MAGYIGIGIPCGIMESSIGMNAFMAFAMSMTFYSGAGQFMISNLWMAGSPLVSIIASVSFVNTRQMLYSAAFSPYFEHARKRLTFLFSATVTDESFGVNLAKFQEGAWTPGRATLVNLLCMTTWAVANVAGVLLGNALSVPTAIAAFAMTSIFICLLSMQDMNRLNVLVILVSAVAVCVFKSIGLSGPAILLGAFCGVALGMVCRKRRRA